MSNRIDMERIIKKLSKSIFHKHLTTKPSYYIEITKIFKNYDEVPCILRHPIIRKNDESISLFLSTLKNSIYSLDSRLVGVLCSGSGLLTQELVRTYHNDKFNVHHFDFSKIMLKQYDLAEKKFLVDLSKPIKIPHKYDVVLSLGNLRYFSDCLSVFSENIRKLMKKNGVLLLGEVDEELISSFVGLLDQKGFSYQIASKRGTVFRNTLFYLILNKFKNDSEFRKKVLSRCALLRLSYEEILIKLAGFKKVKYLYCVGRSY